MHFTSVLPLAALFSAVYAQTTPKGFKPATNSKLEVMFNTTSVKTSGELLSKATTATAPQIAIPNAMGNMSATFMFVMLDLDVPGKQGNAKRQVLLHALNTGLKATKQKAGSAGTLLAASQTGPAPYLPPGPPATDTMAHRYVQLLFQQPANLNVKASDFSNSTARLNFDVEKFMTEHKLAAPVAGNFFMVDGRANSTAGRATPTGSGRGTPRQTTKPFEGASTRLDVSYAMAGLLSMLVMFAV